MKRVRSRCAGPTLMLEYINNPEETAKTIRTDEHGIRWLYTGDIGYMDEDGYLFFKSREKRLLKVSGVSGLSHAGGAGAGVA